MVIDLAGLQFGRLTVISRNADRSRTQAFWVCRCTCGGTATVSGSNLRRGITRSCGCFARQESSRRLSKRETKHGLAKAALYKIHQGILSRCCNPDNPAYDNYGGRGIGVCDRWMSVTTFVEEIERSIGPRPSNPAGWSARSAYWSLDRIDNARGYEPGNVRWADPLTQRRNARQERASRASNGRFAKRRAA